MTSAAAYRPRVIESAAARAEREAAVSKGYDDGIADGRSEAAVELRAARSRLQAEFDEKAARMEGEYRAAVAVVERAAGTLHAALAETVGDAQVRVRETALELAEAIIGAELTEASSRARAAIERVLASVEFEEITEVRLHPDDIAAAEQLPNGPPLKLVADPALSPGDAYAVLADGWLDSRITETLGRVQAALSDEHADEQAHPEVSE